MSALSTRRVLACRDTLAAGLFSRLAGMAPAPAAYHLNRRPPDGVSAWVLQGHDYVAERLDPAPIKLLHADAVHLAWREGAWDIALQCHVAGCAAARATLSSADYLDGSLRADLMTAMERGTLVGWYWRPMRDGPTTRIKANRARDLALTDACSRAGAPPSAALDFRLPRERRVIRLGTKPAGTGSQCRRRPPMMTARQADYIAVLSRRLGLADIEPGRMTRSEASARIDELLGRLSKAS